MKSAQLEDGKGKLLKEVILVCDPKEVLLIHTAVEAYAKANKRKVNAKKLLDELSTASIFF